MILNFLVGARFIRRLCGALRSSEPHCCKSYITLAKITGIEVKTGYSNTIRKRIGGKKGCTHLAHLITIMGREIVHGWLTYNRQEKRSVPDSMEDFEGNEYILNSCKMWSKDGPRWKSLEKALQSGQKQLQSG